MYSTITDHSKTSWSHAHRHRHLCMLDTMRSTSYPFPEWSPAQMDNSDDDWDTYSHFIQPDRHYTTILLYTQWYHSTHLPIPIPAITCTAIDWNPPAYTLWRLQLSIEHRPFICYPLTEEFALGTDPKSLHATVLMQTVHNAVIWHSGGFLKHMVISVVKNV